MGCTASTGPKRTASVPVLVQPKADHTDANSVSVPSDTMASASNSQQQQAGSSTDTGSKPGRPSSEAASEHGPVAGPSVPLTAAERRAMMAGACLCVRVRVRARCVRAGLASPRVFWFSRCVLRVQFCIHSSLVSGQNETALPFLPQLLSFYDFLMSQLQRKSESLPTIPRVVRSKF